MKAPLTKEIAYKALQDFFQKKPFVLFGTGTSCAVDLRFGMPALQKHLEDTILKLSFSPEQKAEWNAVLTALNKGADFETSMNAVKDNQLLKDIIASTAQLMSNVDKQHAADILTGNTRWPAIGLIEKLVNGLPETDRTLHIATPNYDLLAEYSFSHARIPYVTGFWNGINRKLNWAQAEREVTYAERAFSGRKMCIVTRLKKHIRLYKVHGSLNVFSTKGEIVENNAWVYDPPNCAERIMITPGTSKYEQLHQHRYELLGEFDRAVQCHNAFLFLGYGFNDNQLNNNAIIRKLKDQGCQGLIITRDCNSRIKRLLSECINLWIVCKQDITGKEDTQIFNSAYADWLPLNGVKLWRTETFSKEILGG